MNNHPVGIARPVGYLCVAGALALTLSDRAAAAVRAG